jgi:predicted dehydrogenase
MMLTGAIIGFGEVARNGHWPAYAASTEAEIVAVVDRSESRRDLAASLKPGLRTFATIDALAASTSLDFVDICTPPALHPEPMLEALACGWHVLCEKPFLLDPMLVDRVRALAAGSGLAVVPVHNWKYAPIVRAATSALRDGAIGRLHRVEIQTSRLRAAPTSEAGKPNWRRDPAMAGGGILMDHGWHSVYLALHWFGDRAKEVRAELHHPPSGGVEDEASVTIDFPAGVATIELTWNGSVRRNAMRLAGSSGEIVIDDDILRVNGVKPYVWTFGSALSAGSAHADWFTDMLPDVVRCFRKPERSRDLFEEAAECLSLIQSAYRGSNAPV